MAVCGLQLTFWERATNWTGEMFDLLLFAVVIWSLLEYRLDEREWRLFVAAFVYGAGMTDDWGMTGFLPLFLVAIVWMRGFDFFNWRFLGRMLLCGLAGMLFYLLLPLLAVVSHKVPATFWQILKFNLAPQYGVLKTYFTFGLHPQQHIEYPVPVAGLPDAAVRDGVPLEIILWRQQPVWRGAGQFYLSSASRPFSGGLHLDDV